MNAGGFINIFNVCWAVSSDKCRMRYVIFHFLLGANELFHICIRSTAITQTNTAKRVILISILFEREIEIDCYRPFALCPVFINEFLFFINLL